MVSSMYKFSFELLVMPLEGCEMILGIKWLLAFGDIIVEFQGVEYVFQYEGDSHWLQEVNNTSVKVVSESNILRMTKRISTTYDCSIKIIIAGSLSGLNQI